MGSGASATSPSLPLEECMVLTRSWVSVVCSTATLSPALARSACRHLEEYSSESEETFWALVGQHFNAKYARDDGNKSWQELRGSWEQIRPLVAQFHQVFTELWPTVRADQLDTLPSQQHHNVLKQTLEAFQVRTGEAFKYLGVWNILARHAKWEKVLKPLVMDQEEPKQPRADKKRAVLEVDAAVEKEGVQHFDEEKASTAKPATVTPTASDASNKKQRVEATDVALEEDKAPPPGDMSSPGDESQSLSTVEDVYLALAWIGVTCSFADTSLEEETYDCFWLLVSTYYYDSHTSGNSQRSSEKVLKRRWTELKTHIATFHRIYENVRSGGKNLTRMDREDVIAQAMESFWKLEGSWFQHRAVWEIFERHVDWESVLKPIILHGESSSSNAPQKDTTNKAAAVETDNKTSKFPMLPLEVHVNAAGLEKESPWMEQWLELSKRRLELDVMTQTDHGLTPAAVEYFHLQRQKIVQRARLEANAKKE